MLFALPLTSTVLRNIHDFKAFNKCCVAEFAGKVYAVIRKLIEVQPAKKGQNRQKTLLQIVKSFSTFLFDVSKVFTYTCSANEKLSET